MPTSRADDSRDLLGLRLESAGFALGSFGFVLGAVLSIVGRGPVNLIFAIGAIFFTSAAWVQWRVSVNHHPLRQMSRARAETDLRNPDWTSAITQLLGTLYFNAMTLRALTIYPTDMFVYNKHVWKPDAIGSALFLVSSLIAFAPVSRLRRHRLVSRRSWLIVSANLLGSIFFAISAVGSKATIYGTLVHLSWSNLGTLLGGLCFLAGALLLLPRGVADNSPREGARSATVAATAPPVHQRPAAPPVD